MKVLKRPIDSLHLDPANARRHPQRNLEAIKASLARFGQQTPIVVGSDMVVRKGNGTLEAAKALGWAEVAIIVTDLKGSELTAYAVADNRTSELAEWDADVLTATLESLRDEDEALLEAAGFTDEELGRFAAEGVDFPDLPDGDKDEVGRLAFGVTEAQREEVQDAINRASADGDEAECPNRNTRGLLVVVRAYGR